MINNDQYHTFYFKTSEFITFGIWIEPFGNSTKIYPAIIPINLRFKKIKKRTQLSAVTFCKNTQYNISYHELYRTCVGKYAISIFRFASLK